MTHERAAVNNPVATGTVSPLPGKVVWWQQGLLILSSRMMGVLLIEAGRLLLNIDSEIAASIYAILLSCVMAFIMWIYMYQTLFDFDFYMIGFISGGFLDIVFRGLPRAVNINHEILRSMFVRIYWLQVFRRADAALLGSERRQQHQTTALREEKCVGL